MDYNPDVQMSGSLASLSSAPTKSNPVLANSMQNLEGLLDRLDEQVRKLGSKLEPIMGPSMRIDKDPGMSPTDPNYSIVVSTVNSYITKIDQIGQYVHDLIDRVQL